MWVGVGVLVLLHKFRIWEDIRLKDRQGQGKRSLEARADAFSRLKRLIYFHGILKHPEMTVDISRKVKQNL